MKKDSHKSDSIRGALWLVDNDPDDEISRDEQNARIGSYLSRHAHYCYFGRNPKDRHLRAMTVDRFRRVMIQIASYSQIQHHGVYAADLLWKVKSRGLSKDYLAKHNYDPMTFTEAELPGPVDAVASNNMVLPSDPPAVLDRTTTRSASVRAEGAVVNHKSSRANDTYSRRSRLIAILDVENSNATGSRKYLEQPTRHRALLLLIKQYKLTYWDRRSHSIVELTPTQLIRSLQRSFHTGDIITMTEFWRFGSPSARDLLRDSEPNIENHESYEGLPTYGTLPFVHSSNDVELALREAEDDVVDDDVSDDEGMEYGVVGDEDSSEEPAPSALGKNLDNTESSLSKLSVPLSSYASLVAIEAIDESKSDCKRDDYPYSSRARQLVELRVVIERFSLQHWDKRKRAIVDLTPQSLRTMLSNLFYRHSSKRETVAAAEIWSQGSSAFGAATMKRLRDDAETLQRDGMSSRAHMSRMVITNAGLDANKSRRNGTGDEVITAGVNDSINVASKDLPSKHSRKRKATEVDLDSCSSSYVSARDEFISDLSWMDQGGTPSSLPLGHTRYFGGHSDHHPAHHQSPRVTIEEDQLSDTVKLDIIAENSATFAPTQAEIMRQEMDLRRLNSNVAGISSSIQHAVDTLFGSLHLDVVLQSPTPEPTGEPLMTLFRRCWGEDWRSVCQSMAVSRLCSAFNALKALIAAFLFENVFNEDTSWQIDIFKSFALPFPDQQETWRIFLDLAYMDSERYLEAQRKAHTLLARGILKSELPVLQHHSNKLAESFLLLINDHLASLSHLADFNNSHNVQSDIVALEDELRGPLARTMEEASALKLYLTRSNCYHKFFWPASGTVFDPVEMESVHPLQDPDDRIVTFTVFPGLSVQIGDHEHVVRPAHTVTSAQDGRGGSWSSSRD